jgi:hypothetical protein
MIQIIRERGCRVSVITCNECGERITDSSMAAALDGPGDAAWHVHKGRCHDLAERAAGARGWMELREHIEQITSNSQLSPPAITPSEPRRAIR